MKIIANLMSLIDADACCCCRDSCCMLWHTQQNTYEQMLPIQPVRVNPAGVRRAPKALKNLKSKVLTPT